MFARVATYEVPGHRFAEIVSNFEGAIEQIKEMGGLREAYVLVSPDDNRALTMTVWASQAAMESSRVTASRLRGEAAQATDGGVLSVQEYEVAVHEVAGSAA